MPTVPPGWFHEAQAARVAHELQPADAAYLAQQLRAHGHPRLATVFEVELLQAAGYDTNSRGPGSLADAISGPPPAGPIRQWASRVAEKIGLTGEQPPEVF
jgi:hypothetical protein